MENALEKEEKLLSPMNGLPMLMLILLLYILSIAGFVASLVQLDDGFSAGSLALLLFCVLWWGLGILPALGLKVINPNEAAVYVLFGRYYGTIAQEGFFYINPFCVAVNPTAVPSESALVKLQGLSTGTVSLSGTGKKVSLKATTLNNDRQKINDREGNPIDIGVIVIWRVVNATKAVFAVDNYKEYISIQCDAALRNVARQYPYDISEDGDEMSLRGSSGSVADELKKELQNRVDMAGVEIMETRISHLAYSQEIAAAMLQRQQAAAIIAAKQKIVEGAVGMVETALNRLAANDICDLDEERKAAMVSNLLVVLCGNKEAQPIVNSGSIY